MRPRSRVLRRNRSLALCENAPGFEAIERFVAEEGQWRVREAVFGVLALESEPVGARL